MFLNAFPQAYPGKASASSEPSHVPVMLREVCDQLVQDPGGRYLDATLGGGGHSAEILSRLSAQGRLVGTDPDPRQLERARTRLSGDSRALLLQGWADESGPRLAELGFLPLDGVLADFGLSMDQLKDEGRGLSFRQPDAPLDMRFNPNDPETAAEILRDRDPESLRRLLAEGGVDRGRESLVQRLVRAGRLETVGDLAEIAGPRRGRLHPATLLFQALRMRVNRELERIQKLLGLLPGWLRPGGRAVFLTYHSLEDRLVKNALRGGQPGLRGQPRKAIKPSREESRSNPPSRSAKLRVAVAEAA